MLTYNLENKNMELKIDLTDQKLKSSVSALFEFTAVGNDDVGGGSSRLASLTLDSLDNVHPINNLSEDNVLSIEPASWDGADEELTSVSVRSSIGHTQDSGSGVLLLEVFVREFLTIDAFTWKSGISYMSLNVMLSPPVPFPRVKSPPWSMKLGITRWNLDPL